MALLSAHAVALEYVKSRLEIITLIVARLLNTLSFYFQCPYCHRDDTVESAARDEGFFLEDLDGQYQLKRNHTYYYQVYDTTIQ